MIYSKAHDFLFIKGKKVAGTSVEMALSCVCGPEDIITPLAPIEELEKIKLGGRGAQNYSPNLPGERSFLRKLALADLSEINAIPRPKLELYSQHMTLRQFENRHGGIPTQRVFCIERSPYAKIISAANMGGKFNAYLKSGGRMEFDLEHVRRVVQHRIKVNRLVEHSSNIGRYRSLDGTLRTRAIRFEDLPQSFNTLMAEYGIVPPPPLPHAKWGANANEIDPLSVFTREQIDLINVGFADEFDAFGYERL